MCDWGGLWRAGAGGRYTARAMKRLSAILAASLFAIALAAGPAIAAPPGWELRNGTWVPLVEPSSETPDGQVAQMIRDLQAAESTAKPDKSLAKRIVKTAKKWEKANKTHPLMPQVLLLHGDAEVLRGNKYASLFPYEDLLNNYPGTDLFVPTLQREYNIADAFLKGEKRTFIWFRILPADDDALQLLDRIQDRDRGSAVAEESGLREADYYFDSGKFPEAIDLYTLFLQRYGKFSQYTRKAELRRVEASLGNFRGLLFDFTPLYDARERLATVADAYPQSAQDLQVKAIDDRIYQLEGEKDLEIARYYLRAGKKHASAYYYRRVIENWPDTSYAQTARKELSARLPGEQP